MKDQINRFWRGYEGKVAKGRVWEKVRDEELSKVKVSPCAKSVRLLRATLFQLSCASRDGPRWWNEAVVGAIVDCS